MRRSSFFWGLVIVLAGVLLLLEQFNLLPVPFWSLFWPLVMVLAGLGFLLGPVLFKPDYTEHPLQVSLDGAAEAKIKFRHGAGRLSVNALPSGSLDLISGTTAGRPNVDVDHSESRLKVRLSAEEASWGVARGMQGFSWKLAVNQDVPLKLDVKSGASEIDLDLADLRVVELSIDTGASSTTVTLPARAGFTTAAIKGGAAAFKLRIPDGVAARIHLQTGMMGVSVDTARFPKTGEAYESPDYMTAANKVELRFEGGMGSVDIH